MPLIRRKLYKNMVDARAEWLYELPQWKDIYSEEELKRLYKEQRESRTVRKGKKTDVTIRVPAVPAKNINNAVADRTGGLRGRLFPVLRGDLCLPA